jgi:tRNA uridine 5-carboxymethylaminomethyl modification enzyme
VLAKAGLTVRQDGKERTAEEWLAFANVEWRDCIAVWPVLAEIDLAVADMLVTDSRYASYLARQEIDVERFGRDEALHLPIRLDYSAIAGLSTEMRERLQASRPSTIGAAGRIPGISPAALVALLGHCRRAA